MEAQKAAVEPLPFEPVIATERSCKRARSTPSTSSSSAIRARQMPLPYFGRSNIYEINRRKAVAPDLQDQVGSVQFLEQTDRRIGIDLDDPDRVRLAIDIGKQINRCCAQSQGLCSLLCHRQSGVGRRFERHAATGAQVRAAFDLKQAACRQDVVK